MYCLPSTHAVGRPPHRPTSHFFSTPTPTGMLEPRWRPVQVTPDLIAIILVLNGRAARHGGGCSPTSKEDLALTLSRELLPPPTLASSQMSMLPFTSPNSYLSYVGFSRTHFYFLKASRCNHRPARALHTYTSKLFNPLGRIPSGKPRPGTSTALKFKCNQKNIPYFLPCLPIISELSA